MADQTRFYTRQPDGRLSYFSAAPGAFSAGELSADADMEPLTSGGYHEVPPEVFARQRRGYEQAMPGEPTSSPMLPQSPPRTVSKLPLGASSVAYRAIDGTTPYFRNEGGLQEEGRLPEGEDPQSLAAQGYVFANRDDFTEARSRLDPMNPVQDHTSPEPSAEDEAVDALAREMDKPDPAKEDAPADVDALGKAFDADFAPRTQPRSGATPTGRAPVSVQSVPSTVALASPLGGRQLPSPGASAATGAPSGLAHFDPAIPSSPEDTLATAQQREWLLRGGAGLSRATGKIAAAIAGVKPDEDNAQQLDRSANSTVADYLQRKQAAESEKQKAEQDALKSPASPQSKRLQEVVARTFPGIYSPKQLAHLTMADEPMIFKAGTLRATLDERAQQASDERASREKIAADNLEARKEDSRQRSLDRGLQRELAGQRLRGEMVGREAKASTAGTHISANEAADLGEAGSALSAVDTIYRQFKDKAGGISGAVGSFIPGTDAIQYDNDDRRAAAQVIGRFLEGGKLAANDETKYMNLMPAAGDSDARAQNKKDNLKRLISERQKQRIAGLKSVGYNTGDLGANTGAPSSPTSTGERVPVKRVPNKDRTKYRIDYSDGTSEVVNA